MSRAARAAESPAPVPAGSPPPTPPGPSHQLADAVQDQVDDLLADGVVAAGVVVGRVFLPGDQLLRVEELPVGPRAHLVCGGTAAGLGGRRRGLPICRPAPLLPGRGQVSQASLRQTRPSAIHGSRGSINPEQAPV